MIFNSIFIVLSFELTVSIVFFCSIVKMFNYSYFRIAPKTNPSNPFDGIFENARYDPFYETLKFKL